MAATLIGWAIDIPYPDVQDFLDADYTGIHVYSSATEEGSYSLETTLTLVAGTFLYTYNKPTGLSTDWVQYAPYGLTPGEGQRSEPQPVGAGQVTRLQIRQAVGLRLQMVEIYDLLSAADSTHAVISELIDTDAPAAKYANRFVRVYAGQAIGQTRRLRNATNAGYTPASGTLLVSRAFAPEWEAADSVELWEARGDVDPSALIDQAMNTARRHIWAETSVVVVTGSNDTEYVLPQNCYPDVISRVDICWGTYPDSPYWTQVGYYRPYRENGQNKISLSPSSLRWPAFDSDRLIRVAYSGPVDHLGSDTDGWSVPLDWAVAETGLEYLNVMLGPGGSSGDISDIGRARGEWKAMAEDYRADLMPAPTPLLIVPR